MRYEPTYGVTRADPRPRVWLRLLTLALIVAVLWCVVLGAVVMVAHVL